MRGVVKKVDFELWSLEFGVWKLEVGVRKN